MGSTGVTDATRPGGVLISAFAALKPYRWAIAITGLAVPWGLGLKNLPANTRDDLKQMYHGPGSTRAGARSRSSRRVVLDKWIGPCGGWVRYRPVPVRRYSPGYLVFM